MFLWALALFDEIKPALWTAALTALNQIVYVQARIAMLDVFMFAFVTFGLAAFTYAMKTPSRRRANLAIVAMGLLFGLAGACKISGFFTLVGLAPLAVLVYAAERRRRNDPDPDAPHFGAAVAAAPLVLALGFIVAPAIAYACAYLPQAIRHGSLHFLIEAQQEMFSIMLGHSSGPSVCESVVFVARSSGVRSGICSTWSEGIRRIGATTRPRRRSSRSPIRSSSISASSPCFAPCGAG